MSVVWNGDHYVGSLPITLYKCDILGSHRDHADCSLCVTRASKYRCAWCGSICAYSETCPLSAASECPRPRIDVVRWMSTKFCCHHWPRLCCCHPFCCLVRVGLSRKQTTQAAAFLFFHSAACRDQSINRLTLFLSVCVCSRL